MKQTGLTGSPGTRNSLIGIQNGVEPSRVVRLSLDGDGNRIAQVEILEMNNPRFAEPPLGVVVGSEDYYVANSQGGVLRKPDTMLSKQPLTAPVIVQLRLRKSGSHQPVSFPNASVTGTDRTLRARALWSR